LAVEHRNHRGTAGPGPGHDLGLAVAVGVAGGHVHPAAEVRVEGVEGLHHGAGAAVEHDNLRRAAVARPGDDLGHAVAGHVAECDVDPAAEGRVKGVEGEEHLPGDAIEHVDERGTVHPGPGDRLGDAVAGQVAG